jgi:hypothetical protein
VPVCVRVPAVMCVCARPGGEGRGLGRSLVRPPSPAPTPACLLAPQWSRPAPWTRPAARRRVARTSPCVASRACPRARGRAAAAASQGRAAQGPAGGPASPCSPRRRGGRRGGGLPQRPTRRGSTTMRWAGGGETGFPCRAHPFPAPRNAVLHCSTACRALTSCMGCPASPPPSGQQQDEMVGGAGGGVPLAPGLLQRAAAAAAAAAAAPKPTSLSLFALTSIKVCCACVAWYWPA